MRIKQNKQQQKKTPPIPTAVTNQGLHCKNLTFNKDADSKLKYITAVFQEPRAIQTSNRGRT